MEAGGAGVVEVARVLIVAPPLVGHVNPTISVAAELGRRRHDVSWVGPRATMGPFLPAGSPLVDVGDAIPPEEIEARRRRAYSLDWASALKFFWADFMVPLALAMVPWVDAAVARFSPDLLVVDQQALAGAVVARERNLPWVTSATTITDLIDASAAFPKIEEWIRAQMHELEATARGLSLSEVEPSDLRFSDRLVLGFTTAALAGAEAESHHAQVVLVGPSLEQRRALERTTSRSGPLFELLARRDAPCVFVSLGTVSPTSGARFLRVAIEAIAQLKIRAVVVAPPELVGPVPDRVVVAPWVPQLEVLQEVDAVVCHGGYNTLTEALANGLPLVLAPIAFDQPVNAECAVRAGAAVRVSYRRVKAAELASSIERVLSDPTFAGAAARIQASFALGGGAARAADHIEKLLAERDPVTGRSPPSNRRRT